MDIHSFGNDFSAKVSAHCQRELYRFVNRQLLCLPNCTQQDLTIALWRMCKTVKIKRCQNCKAGKHLLTSHENVEWIDRRRFDANQHVFGPDQDGTPGVAGQYHVVDSTVRVGLPCNHFGWQCSAGVNRIDVRSYVVSTNGGGSGERSSEGSSEKRVLRHRNRQWT